MHHALPQPTFDPAFSMPTGHLTEFSDRWLLVEFQALLRQEGVSIDLKRLQLDPGYAQACLARALESRTPELRAHARRLSASFVLDN